MPDCKGVDFFRDDQELATICQKRDLDRSSTRRHRERVVGNEARTPHPGGNVDNYQNKRVAGKAIRKTMKTKGEQSVIASKAPSLEGCRRKSSPGAWRRIQGSDEEGNGEGGWLAGD